MTVLRPFVLAILSVTTTVGLLLIGAPTASAATAGRYMPAPHPGTLTAAAFSPSGCYQKADNPHDSGHFDGRMNGGIRTKCTRAIPRMSFTAQMWERRWWGWDRIGNKGSKTAYGWSYAEIFANDWCKGSTVRVTGSGFVIDVDQRTYYASTESAHVKHPCRP